MTAHYNYLVNLEGNLCQFYCQIKPDEMILELKTLSDTVITLAAVKICQVNRCYYLFFMIPDISDERCGAIAIRYGSAITLRSRRFDIHMHYEYLVVTCDDMNADAI